MNSIEINEINEMREQLASLKRQLSSQQIVNDRLLKEAMSNKLSTIQRRAIALCVICFVAIPYTYFAFDYLGMSQSFCCATVFLLAGALVAMIISHYRLSARRIMSGDLVAVYEDVTRMRTIYKRWHYVSIPLLVLWLVWGGYDIYTNVTQDAQLLLTIATSATIGGVIGGIFGLRAHKKNLKAAEDILAQIEELKR